MRYVISYDVVSDPRRTRLAHLLEDHGRRVQYSVFECELSQRQLLRLRRQMIAEVDLTTDSIRIYALCVRCRAALEVLGGGPIGGFDRVQVL